MVPRHYFNNGVNWDIRARLWKSRLPHLVYYLSLFQAHLSLGHHLLSLKRHTIAWRLIIIIFFIHYTEAVIGQSDLDGVKSMIDRRERGVLLAGFELAPTMWLSDALTTGTPPPKITLYWSPWSPWWCGDSLYERGRTARRGGGDGRFRTWVLVPVHCPNHSDTTTN